LTVPVSAVVFAMVMHPPLRVDWRRMPLQALSLQVLPLQVLPLQVLLHVLLTKVLRPDTPILHEGRLPMLPYR
jgi:hypothetical protein